MCSKCYLCVIRPYCRGLSLISVSAAGPPVGSKVPALTLLTNQTLGYEGNWDVGGSQQGDILIGNNKDDNLNSSSPSQLNSEDYSNLKEMDADIEILLKDIM